MKKLILLGTLLCFAFAQAQTYSSKIIANDTMLIHGFIGEYPITMYVEYTGFCEYEHEYTGWYKYDSSNVSIPILFYYSSYPEDENFKIYAKYDSDFETEITEEFDCHIIAFDEVFTGTTENGLFNNLNWQKQDSTTGLKVTFQGDPQKKFWELGDQKVYLTKDDRVLLDIGVLGFEYAYHVDVVGQKIFNDVNHLLIEIAVPSRPGGNGRGMCGAGEEIYMLYLRLNEEDKLIYSDSEKIQSCFDYMEESPVSYDVAFPEKGFKRIN
ncbi:hypothetical protein [Nonlabens sp.]|uniref:hypothetical protein n=1 Tax=Nonlabens sp. TaxID=1888209 RepID=UPI003F69C9FC